MSSQIILILVIICLSALLSSHVLACQEILEHTSSSCNHSCLRINPESWRKCITIPISKQPCANTIFDMSHAGIVDVTMLKGHASFVRESLLQACHQDKVFRFEDLALLISTNLLQVLQNILIVNARNAKVCLCGLASVPVHPTTA